MHVVAVPRLTACFFYGHPRHHSDHPIFPPIFTPKPLGRIAYALHIGEKAHQTNVSCSSLSFHFRPREGVCDTPLHLFGDYCGWIGLMITPVRLKTMLTITWQNRQTNRDDADSGYTKPSNDSRRCWLWLHKRGKPFRSPPDRVTQKGRSGCDDEIAFTFFGKCSRDG